MPKDVSFSELAHFIPKQEEALEAVKKFKFLLYGGAMGGGKSYFLRWVAIYLLLNWAQKGIKNVRVGLFCEDYPSLKDRHIIKLQFEFPSWLGTYNSTEHNFTLNTKFGGGVISFRNLDQPGKYASSEFAAILVDELTKNQKDRFDLLRTRMRWPGIPDTKFIAGTNPGSVGHEWVKKIWLRGEFEPGEQEADQFYFVRSKATDNNHLDAGYYRTLEGLPPELKKAFLEGDWDLFQGQFFSEWRESIHVIPTAPLPEEWFRYRSIDFGKTAPFCCKWYTVDYDHNVKVYREYYRAGMDADTNFSNVTKMSGDEVYQWTVLDSACFAATYGASFNRGAGETIADIAWRQGVEALPSPKNRKAGWVIMHQYLRWMEEDSEGKIVQKIPRLQYMQCCEDSIRTIPSLVFSKNDIEDLDTRGEDHAADTDSYFLQMLNEDATYYSPTQKQPTFSQRFRQQKTDAIEQILL